MNCPKCDGVLEPAQIRDTQVDQCSTCRGIWFDEDELPTLLALTPTQLRPLAGGASPEETDRRPAVCPRDQSSLLRVHSANAPRVIVDSCPACRGLWLDGGELEKLLR